MTRPTIALFLIIVIGLADCSYLPESSLTVVTPSPNPSPDNSHFTGRLVDMNGIPVSGASVETENTTTTSNQDGWFDLPSEGKDQWITVKSDGFISRTRAATPGVPVLFRLTPDDGKTIVIQFGGDTMFGRRFFDPNEDGDTGDGLLPLNPTIDDHMKLLAPVKPLLENADFTVVNLETTLSDQPYFSKREPRPAAFHSTSDYVYASHLNGVMALKRSGIDIVDLGNNHNYDLLEVGLSQSLSTLDHAGMLHFGAGKTEADAWKPAIISSKGQTVAFIGCTTVRIPSSSVTKDDIPYVASDVHQKGGAAYCSETPLRSAIIEAKQQADVVIVMIHGGKEYNRTPINKIARLTMAARDAGATLVINHHPHVVGGFLWNERSLIAWSMGNFIFDQTVWPTFESYMLTVYLREGKVIRAYVDPLMIEGYIPHGITGELADYVAREASSNAGPFVIEDGVMEIDVDKRAILDSYTRALDGGLGPGQIFTIPQSQWISEFTGTGNLLLGRDLLWVGGFEDNVVSDEASAAPLWDLTRDTTQVGPDYAYQSHSGIRLTRGASNIQDAVTSSLHRLLVNPNSKLSITGMVRTSPGAVVLMQMSWYSDTKGPSFLKTSEVIETNAIEQWQSFRFDVKVPPEAVALNVFLRLIPPSQGTVTADFDDIKVIEWAPSDTTYRPYYTHFLLVGPGELTLSQQVLPGAEQWITPSLSIQTK